MSVPYVKALSQAEFYRELYAMPETAVRPDDSPAQAAQKYHQLLDILKGDLAAVQSPVWRSFEERLKRHLYIIGNEKIWEALEASDIREVNRLRAERAGILALFNQFADLPAHIAGTQAALAALGSPDPDLHEPGGQPEPVLQ